MHSVREDMQFKQGCAVGIKYIFSRSEDVQYEQGIPSVQMRMYSTIKAYHQYE